MSEHTVSHHNIDRMRKIGYTDYVFCHSSLAILSSEKVNS